LTTFGLVGHISALKDNNKTERSCFLKDKPSGEIAVEMIMDSAVA
jgi:hypothetical protein